MKEALDILRECEIANELSEKVPVKIFTVLGKEIPRLYTSRVDAETNSIKLTLNLPTFTGRIPQPLLNNIDELLINAVEIHLLTYGAQRAIFLNGINVVYTDLVNKDGEVWRYSVVKDNDTYLPAEPLLIKSGKDVNDTVDNIIYGGEGRPVEFDTTGEKFLKSVGKWRLGLPPGETALLIDISDFDERFEVVNDNTSLVGFLSENNELYELPEPVQLQVDKLNVIEPVSMSLGDNVVRLFGVCSFFIDSNGEFSSYKENRVFGAGADGKHIVSTIPVIEVRVSLKE